MLFARGLATLTFTALFLAAAPAGAQGPLKDENILMPIPPGFKLASHQENRTNLISEFAPENETIDTWTKLVTEQIFRGLGGTSAKAYAQGMAQRLPSSCPGATTRDLADATENGYPVSTWLMACPRNPGTGLPEMFVIKVIQGKDALYATQYAFKKTPDQALIDEATAFLRQVTVCDTRLRDRPCPSSLTPVPASPPNGAANPVSAFLHAADANDATAMKALLDGGGDAFLRTINGCYLRRVYGNNQTGEILASWMCDLGPNRSRVVVAAVTRTPAGKVAASVQANTTNERPAPARSGSAFDD